jgi:hypothetical protein
VTGSQTHDGNNRRHGGTPLQQFEWWLRAHAPLNKVARVVWHLTALSAKRPANISIPKLAAQLGVPEWVVRKAIRLVAVELKLFKKSTKGYSRTSSGKDFARTVRKCKKLNLIVRLAWLLVDLLSGSKDGKVTIGLSAMAKELNSEPDLVSVAAQKLVVESRGVRGRDRRPPLGLFSRESGPDGRYHYRAVFGKMGSAGDGKTIDQDGNPVDDDFDYDPSGLGTQSSSSYRDHFAKYGAQHGNRSSVRN